MLISSPILANNNHYKKYEKYENELHEIEQNIVQMKQLVKSQKTQIDALKAKNLAQDNAIQIINSQMSDKTTLTQVQSYFQNNGIKLGHRWLIKEEGTGTYEALVFRDLITIGEHRYAMFQNKNVDL